jgi:hypothetical protein
VRVGVCFACADSYEIRESARERERAKGIGAVGGGRKERLFSSGRKCKRGEPFRKPLLTCFLFLFSFPLLFPSYREMRRRESARERQKGRQIDREIER